MFCAGAFITLIGLGIFVTGLVFNILHNNRMNGDWIQIEAQVVGYRLGMTSRSAVAGGRATGGSSAPLMIFQFEHNGTTFRAIQTTRSTQNRNDISVTQIQNWVVNVRSFTIWVNPQVLANEASLDPFIYIPRDPSNVRIWHTLFATGYDYHNPTTRVAYTDSTLTERILALHQNDSIIPADGRLWITLIILGGIVMLPGLCLLLPAIFRRSDARRRISKPRKPRSNTTIHSRSAFPHPRMSSDELSQWEKERRQRPYQSGSFSVHLISVPPAFATSKIDLIKIVREYNPGMSLGNAKSIVDNPPQLVTSGMAQQDAEILAQRLRDFKAEAEVR